MQCRERCTHRQTRDILLLVINLISKNSAGNKTIKWHSKIIKNAKIDNSKMEFLQIKLLRLKTLQSVLVHVLNGMNLTQNILGSRYKKSRTHRDNIFNFIFKILNISILSFFSGINSSNLVMQSG